MADFALLKPLLAPGSTKIVMVVMDGLGGLPREEGGKTELESAHRPNLNQLAKHSILGLADAVGPGITPGSGPGHLGLFGYDPLVYVIGRGVLEALGIDFPLGPEDVAARGNFCTVDMAGRITDRRAGRISTEKCKELVKLLRRIQLDGAEVLVEPVKEHRFVMVLRGVGLQSDLTGTDPERVGVSPFQVQARSADSARAASLANEFIRQAGEILHDEHPANMLLLRGFACKPAWPTFEEGYGLRAASIAVYPMYRGVSRLVGMLPLEVEGETIADEFTTLEKHWGDFDFFFLHVKKTDSMGEDGDFDGKAKVIEELDGQLQRLMALAPDVVIVGGDHSTPAVLKAHSWHPVPVLIYSRWVRADGLAEFGEAACSRGSLGRFRSSDIMPIAVANARRLVKYGA